MCCFYDQTWRGAIPGPSFCVSKELCSWPFGNMWDYRWWVAWYVFEL
jgi:hypothetical protein